MEYIVVSKVRRFLNEGGKRVSPEFLKALDRYVEDIMVRACYDPLLRNHKTLKELELSYLLNGSKSLLRGVGHGS